MTELISATKRFGEKTVLCGQSFTFPSGKALCVIGESGCGKTTLLRILSGLSELDSGTVLRPEAISYSFQEPRLFPQLTALQNVCVTSDRNMAEQLLSALELSGEMDKYPDELSGGMRQRVSVARAIGAEAELYLFDEPTAALDVASSQRCIDLILNRLSGKSVIISTHSALVQEACDIVIQLENGMLTRLR